MPMYSEKLQEQLLSKDIVLGGCEIYNGNPIWQCTKCKLDIF